jgi:predicted small secreted protein
MSKMSIFVVLSILTAGCATADIMIYGQGTDVTISRPYCST